MVFHRANFTRVASRASFLIALACLLVVCLPLNVSAKSRRAAKAKSSQPEFVAREAKPDSTGDRTLTRTLDLKVRRIVIDPGHGGFDNGTVGVGGLQEKELVLDVAQRLGKILQRRMGADVIYTRDSDKFIPLETRTEIANHEDADLFISVHGNHSDDPQTRGIETYYLSFTAATDALEVASRENAASEMSVGKLQDLVKQIAMNEKVGESREFAANVQRALWAGLGSSDSAIRDRGVKKAPFIVLIGAHMPSILAEISFLSNSADEQKLKESQYREQIAESLYRGISKYVGGLSGGRAPTAVASTAPVGIHLPPLATPPAAVAPMPVPVAPASNLVPPTLTTARPPFSGAGPAPAAPVPPAAARIAATYVPPTLTTARPPFSGAGPAPVTGAPPGLTASSSVPKSSPPPAKPAPAPSVTPPAMTTASSPSTPTPAPVTSNFVPPTLTTARPIFSGAGSAPAPNVTPPVMTATPPASTVASSTSNGAAPAGNSVAPGVNAPKAPTESAATETASSSPTATPSSAIKPVIASKPSLPAVSIDWNAMFLGFILHRKTLIVMALLLAAAWSIAHDYNEPARRFARRHYAPSPGSD